MGVWITCSLRWHHVAHNVFISSEFLSSSLLHFRSNCIYVVKYKLQPASRLDCYFHGFAFWVSLTSSCPAWACGASFCVSGQGLCSESEPDKLLWVLVPLSEEVGLDDVGAEELASAEVASAEVASAELASAEVAADVVFASPDLELSLSACNKVWDLNETCHDVTSVSVTGNVTAPLEWSASFDTKLLSADGDNGEDGSLPAVEFCPDGVLFKMLFRGACRLGVSDVGSSICTRCLYVSSVLLMSPESQET